MNLKQMIGFVLVSFGVILTMFIIQTGESHRYLLGVIAAAMVLGGGFLAIMYKGKG